MDGKAFDSGFPRAGSLCAEPGARAGGRGRMGRERSLSVEEAGGDSRRARLLVSSGIFTGSNGPLPGQNGSPGKGPRPILLGHERSRAGWGSSPACGAAVFLLLALARGRRVASRDTRRRAPALAPSSDPRRRRPTCSWSLSTPRVPTILVPGATRARERRISTSSQPAARGSSAATRRRRSRCPRTRRS